MRPFIFGMPFEIGATTGAELDWEGADKGVLVKGMPAGPFVLGTVTGDSMGAVVLGPATGAGNEMAQYVLNAMARWYRAGRSVHYRWLIGRGAGTAGQDVMHAFE